MRRTSTGNAQLDQILDGGLLGPSINIVMGTPGSGKTILVEQLAFANGTKERPVLYLTTLSEPLQKLVMYLQRFSFCDVNRIGSEIIYDSLRDILLSDPTALYERVQDLIVQHRPSVLIIDSFKAIADLMPDVQQWRGVVFRLAELLTAYDATTVWVGEYTEDQLTTSVEFAVADGVLMLKRDQNGSRDDRFLRVAKLRGSNFLGGNHAFILSPSGLEVYPRLVAPDLALEPLPRQDRLSTGVEGLDALIEAGCLRGTSTLVEGPSGSGKTILGLHFLRQGVMGNEPGLLINFQETPAQLTRTIQNLGWHAEALLAPGKLDVLYTSPVELQIDTIVGRLFSRLKEGGARRIVIDALGDLEASARDPNRFNDYVYALTQHLAAFGATTMLLLESPSGGPVNSRVSNLSDNLLLLGMELGPVLKRSFRILKTRGSAHDPKLHTLTISSGGMKVGGA